MLEHKPGSDRADASNPKELTGAARNGNGTADLGLQVFPVEDMGGARRWASPLRVWVKREKGACG